MILNRLRLIFSALVIGCVLCFAGMPFAALAQAKIPVNPSNAPRPNYRIRQGDKLSVKFFYQPELNEPSIIVRPDGFISLQMIDDIQVEGLTVAELKKNLEKAYEEILMEPIISVAVLEFVAPRVFIGGEVNKPGRYDLRDGKTLVEVIFLAGGFTRDANKKMIMHARPDGRGDWQIQSVNAMQILNQKGIRKDLMLQDGDYIFIPQSRISRISKAVEAFRGLLPMPNFF